MKVFLVMGLMLVADLDRLYESESLVVDVQTGGGGGTGGVSGVPRRGGDSEWPRTGRAGGGRDGAFPRAVTSGPDVGLRTRLRYDRV